MIPTSRIKEIKLLHSRFRKAVELYNARLAYPLLIDLMRRFQCYGLSPKSLGKKFSEDFFKTIDLFRKNMPIDTIEQWRENINRSVQ